MNVPARLAQRLWQPLPALALAGCTAFAAEAPAPGASPRGLVALPPSGLALVAELSPQAQARVDTGALAVRLQAAAGVPVRDLRPVAPRHWAFTLRCDGAAACDAARSRLAAERGLVQHLQNDPPAQLPPSPRGESAR